MAKRSKERYPGLSKNGDIKIRHELYHVDYLDKLTHEEKLLAI